MPDLSAISAAITSFNTLKDIAQTMIGLHDAKALTAKIVEFNNAIIDTQAKVFLVSEERAALEKRVRELEKELAYIKAWNPEKYELKVTHGGGVVWSLKVEAGSSETPHQICTKCYEDGKRSILQPEGRSGPAAHMGNPAKLYCPICSSKVLA
jgi:hypothetical protein